MCAWATYFDTFWADPRRKGIASTVTCGMNASNRCPYPPFPFPIHPDTGTGFRTPKRTSVSARPTLTQASAASLDDSSYRRGCRTRRLQMASRSAVPARNATGPGGAPEVGWCHYGPSQTVFENRSGQSRRDAFGDMSGWRTRTDDTTLLFLRRVFNRPSLFCIPEDERVFILA